MIDPRSISEVKAWAYLLERGLHASLWTWLKACDPNGSGIVTFRLSDAAQELKRTHQSIRRYLKRGKAEHWFRAVENLGRGQYRVVLSSLYTVAKALGFRELGPCALAPVDRLAHPKILATDIVTEDQQEASRHAKKQELKAKKIRNNHPPDAGRIFAKLRFGARPSSTSSPRGTGASSRGSQENSSIIGSGDHCLFVSEKFPTYGCSQATVATKLGKSLSTIKRRQNGDQRCKQNIPAILKRQIAQKVNPPQGIATDQHLANLQQSAKFMDWAPAQTEIQRHFVCRGQLWYARNNLYLIQDITLKRRRHIRKFWRKKMDSLSHAMNGISCINGSRPAAECGTSGRRIATSPQTAEFLNTN